MWKKLFWKVWWNGVVGIPLLLWFSIGTTALEAVLASVALTCISFLVVDLMILRSSNNVIATVSDTLLAFFVVWITAYYAKWTLTFTELCVISVALGVVEYWYHRYLASDGDGRFASR